ncbi:Ion transport protein-domain-containing protein [Lipomyces japonicus]|uniref:Ion transport protein-domain-containing protein n=1 Tax=Lipomyces japonicus TaxID=56871 RepID=UPI0034CDE9AA
MESGLLSHEPELGGHSLAFFSPTNVFRIFLYHLISHSFYNTVLFVILLLHTIIVTYRTVKLVDYDGKWGSTWVDWALLVIFIIYTLDALFQIIVSGFILNPSVQTSQAVYEFFQILKFGQLRNGLDFKHGIYHDPAKTTLGRSLTELAVKPKPDQKIHRLAYLRSSWHRLDFICVLFYWMYLITSGIVAATDRNISAVALFRAICSLKILRWLMITKGTAAILASLKKAAPLLVNVGLFISVFWSIFALIGIQAFHSSFKRQCVWIGENGKFGDSDNYVYSMQFCGGYLDANTLEKKSFIDQNGHNAAGGPKGFLCPVYSECHALPQNPYNNTLSFDNVLQSLELVFVVMGMNGFSDLMNYTSQSDHLASALFFVAGVIILAWWLFNLFIAIISSSFVLLKEESNTSPFTDNQVGKNETDQTEINSIPVVYTKYRRIYLSVEPVFILLVFIDFVVQCFKTNTMSDRKSQVLFIIEIITSLLLLFEIFFRFTSYIPRWRFFFLRPENYIDFTLAVITCIILLPAVHDSRIAYPWLTVFQVIRIYRVVVAVNFTRKHWVKVMGKFYNLVNLVIFFLLMLFLCSLIACELLSGHVPNEYLGNQVDQTFANLANSFAAIYQIMTTEGWAQILYITVGTLASSSLAWVSAIFICGWFLFSNAVIINLFIAAIQENFEVSDDEKRAQQIRDYSEKYAPVEIGDGPFSFTEAFTSRERRRRSTAVAGLGGHGVLELLHNEQAVDEFMTRANTFGVVNNNNESQSSWSTPNFFSFAYWKKKFTIKYRKNPFYGRPTLKFDVPTGAAPSTFIEQVMRTKAEQKKERDKFVMNNPNFNRALFCLDPQNKLRRMCQKIVGPTHGKRYDGEERNLNVARVFSGIIMVCVIGMVILACVVTPYFQKNYYAKHSCDSSDSDCAAWNRMTFCDIAFAIVFTIEALVKIIADGFVYTPNAYLWSTWNAIDFLVLVTLWIDIIVTMAARGTSIRFLRAFKAFRALRLLHVNETAKQTFHNIIIVGLGEILGAAVVSLTLLVPFALWGLNIFAGKFDLCNDGDNNKLSQCTGEFQSTVSNWDVTMPRTYQTPGYSFDSFWQSLSILFQIISLEGWNDVLASAQAVTGIGLNPQQNHSVFNGLFIYVFNFISIVFIATLFITVIMQSYSRRTGVGFLTSDQRSFMEVQNILKKVRPSRIGRRPSNSIKAWCYDKAVARNGSWNKVLTYVLFLQVVLLISDYYPSSQTYNMVKDVIYLASSAIVVIYLVVRMIGLPWSSNQVGYLSWYYCKRNLWEIFWLPIVSVSFTLSLVVLVDDKESLSTIKKLMFSLVTLMLIRKSNRLNQLLVAVGASSPALLSLLFTWFVLFLVYAIAFNQIFGLTRIGPNGSPDVNFRTIPRSILLLFRMSCGEGWNSIMYDYTIQSPYCIEVDNFFDSDCGSQGYAYALFFSWNILSMYIFANMFISLIYNSFSYVYQQSSNAVFISRNTLRAYKDAWAQLDRYGTGYIDRDQVGMLLRLLPNVLKMRIYESPNTYSDIRQKAKISALQSNHGRIMAGIDIDELETQLNRIDMDRVAHERRKYTRLYQEIISSAEIGKGIPFSVPLMLIPFYKISNANQCITLDQYIQRRIKLKYIDDQIKRDKVTSFSTMLRDRKRFLQVKPRLDRKPTSQSTVPKIVIEPVVIDE